MTWIDTSAQENDSVCDYQTSNIVLDVKREPQ